MEDRRFDEITKKLTTGASRSRRGVLKGLAAGAAGALTLGLAGRQAAQAAPCPPNREKCGGGCCSPSQTCVNRRGGKVCVKRNQIQAQADPVTTCGCERGVQTCRAVETETATTTATRNESRQCGTTGGPNPKPKFQNVTITDTFETTTTTTTTQQFRGCGNQRNPIGEPTETVVVGDPVLVDSDETPSGSCNASGN